MKKISLIILSVLLVFTLASCEFFDRIFSPEEEREHTGDNACEHVYDDCADVECNKCGEKRDSMHTWADADCDSAKTCTVCGATEGAALGHTPSADDGDCTTAITCSACGVITTPAREGHTGGEATCVSGKICTECNTAYGELNSDNHDLTTIDDNGVCGCGERLSFVITNSGVSANYDSFADALSSWTDGTVLTLYTDVTYDGKAIEILNKSVTLDLNGKTLTVSNTILFYVGQYDFTHNDLGEMVEIITPGELTVRDSGNGGEISTTHVFAAVYGRFNLEGGTINNWVNILHCGAFTMTGGEIVGNTMNTLASAIQNEGIANVSGGTLRGQYGVWTCADSVTNISGDAVIIGTDINEFNPGAAIYIAPEANVVISGAPTLSGGSYGELHASGHVVLNTLPADGQIWRVYYYKDDNPDGIFAVAGEGIELDIAKFASAKEGYNVGKLASGELMLCNCTKDLTFVANTDGTHTAHCNLCGAEKSEAHSFTDGSCVCGAVTVADFDEIAAAIEKGGTIMLSEDIVLSDVGDYMWGLPVTKDTTIILNGHTIRSNHCVFNVSSGTLTVLGDGTLTVEQPHMDRAINVGGSGVVNLHGGTVEGVLYVERGGVANVFGGTVYSLNAGMEIGGVTISGGYIYELSGNSEEIVIITGGVFDFDPTWYLPDGYTATYNENDNVWIVTKVNNE